MVSVIYRIPGWALAGRRRSETLVWADPCAGAGETTTTTFGNASAGISNALKMAMVNGIGAEEEVLVNGLAEAEAALVNGHVDDRDRDDQPGLENDQVDGEVEVNGGEDGDPPAANGGDEAPEAPEENNENSEDSVSDDSETATGNGTEDDTAMGTGSDDSEPVPRRAILVTGGAGYVGSHTIMNLIEQGEHDDLDIVVIDNLSNAYKGEAESKPESLRIIEEMTQREIEFYDIDIRNKDQLSVIFSEHNVQFVYHFAALKAVGESVVKPLEYYEANITGTTTLLDVMRKHNVYKLIYSSSCTVYGEPQYLPIDEEHPTGNGLTSPYGRTKFFCEELMKDVCASESKWSIISLRYFNPVGAHRSGRIGEDPDGIPNNLMPYIAQVAVGRLNMLLVFGDDYKTIDGTGVRDFIHVEDLADGHVSALKLFSSDTFAGGFQPINLGTGNGYSVLQMVAMFERVCGRKVPYAVVGRREGDIAENYADVSLAERLLDWRAVRTLYSMCDDTWRWQSANPNGYKKTNIDED